MRSKIGLVLLDDTDHRILGDCTSLEVGDEGVLHLIPNRFFRSVSKSFFESSCIRHLIKLFLIVERVSVGGWILNYLVLIQQR